MQARISRLHAPKTLMVARSGRALSLLAVPNDWVAWPVNLMGSAPLRKSLQNSRWVTVNLGEASGDVARIEVRGVDTIGKQLARRL